MHESIDNSWLMTLQSTLRRCGERRLVVLAGSAAWTRDRLREITAAWQGAWLWAGRGQALVPQVALEPERVLGGEWDGIAIDGYAGLRPDLLGAASGALRGGGILVLLAPAIADWPTHRDPDYDGRARAGLQPPPGTRFWQRLRQLLDSPAVLLVEQGRQHGALSVEVSTTAWPGPRFTEQAAAVQAVLRCAQGRAHRPLVLMADRGRGKSAALGLAAAELLRAGRNVAVTGPRASACERLFHHAALALGLEHAGGHRLAAGGELRYWPIDELIPALEAQQLAADLLLVDEAAALPVSALQSLLAHPRVVFATTIHGYEGSGRGFERRFLPQLADTHPQWRRLWLSEPLRWAQGDPLEAWISRALLLDAEPAAAAAAGDPVRVERISQDRLATDEALLRDLFGLLVQAHYRTSPDDLRDLLDGSNLEIWVARQGAAVAGVLVAAREGALPAALHEPILLGRRRIRGHLLPQSLAFHGGQPWALTCRWQRIVRIAVAASKQRQGIARQLLDAFSAAAAERGEQLVGASFAASAPLIRFWQQLGFHLLRVGTRLHAAGGAVPVMVGRALSGGALSGRALADDCDQELTATAAHCAAELPLLLSGALRQLQPAIVRALLQHAAMAPAPLDAIELYRIGHGGRPLESAALLLQQWALLRLRNTAALSRADEALIVGRLLQHQPLVELAPRLGWSGTAAGEARLRELIRQSLAECHCAVPVPDITTDLRS